jgi:hypothetical protein
VLRCNRNINLKKKHFSHKRLCKKTETLFNFSDYSELGLIKLPAVGIKITLRLASCGEQSRLHISTESSFIFILFFIVSCLETYSNSFLTLNTQSN